jgi:anti-sigma B factor antagonist
MDMSYEEHPGCLIVEINAPEVDITVSEEFKENVIALYESQSARNLTLDLKKVSFMDSKAIGAMVAIRKAVVRRNGTMGLCNLHPHVRKIVQVVTLGAIFDLFETKKDSIETYEGSA